MYASTRPSSSLCSFVSKLLIVDGLGMAQVLTGGKLGKETVAPGTDRRRDELSFDQELIRTRARKSHLTDPLGHL